MADMEKLVELVKSVESQVARCTRCGMCQAVCPVYDVSGDEADVARGKLVLVDAMTRHMFDDADGILQRLDRCLLCGKCAAECPRGVETVDIYLKVRAMIAQYKGLSLANRMIFKRMLSNPETLDRIARWGARLQRLITRPASPSVIVGAGPLVSSLLMDRCIPPLASEPFHSAAPAETEAPDGSLTVALFVGCLIDKVFPQIARALMDIFKHHQIRVVIPTEQGCCGIPALSAGDAATFQKLVAHHLERFDPARFDYLVSGCSTCTAVIKHIWPEMAGAKIGEEERLRLQQISYKTIDFSQLIVNVIGVDRGLRPAADLASATRLTYHDPCHLKNLLKCCDEPRTLVSLNPRYAYTEMPGADLCCGMGGRFGLSHPDVASRIGQQKTARICQAGAEVVATGCPACMIQLADLCCHSGRSVVVRHTAEIYAEALKNKG